MNNGPHLIGALDVKSRTQSWNVAVLALVLAIFSVCCTGGGETYYVSPAGDDSNPGTLESPWATPGYASRRLKPGDTLVILGGHYVLSQYDQDIITPPSGSKGKWITIRGEKDNRPLLAGRDNLMAAVDLSGASYVRLENLEITHDDQASGEGMFFSDAIQNLGGPSSHVVLKDLYIHHIDEFGLNFRDIEHLEVVNCRIEYCGFGAIGGPEQEQGGWRWVRIVGCRLSYSGHYYRGGDGSDRPYDRPDGLGIEPSQGPIEVATTVVEHNYGDGLDSKAANTTIRRCIVANNSCDGVKLWGNNSRVENTLIYGRGDGNPQPTPWSAIVIGTTAANSRFEISQVTVDDMLGGNYIMHVQYDDPQIPVQLVLRNNIFRGMGPNCSLFVARGVTLQADYNLFYFPFSEQVLVYGDTIYAAADLYKLGEGNLYGDPLFQAPSWGGEGDYHLQQGSPAVDSGSPQSLCRSDLEGNPRPQGGGYDMGAYEM